MSFDMNDAEPQKTGELIPDGSFAKVTMIIRPGGIDGQAEIDQCLLKAPKDPTSDVRMLDCEFTVVRGPARPAQVLADVHRAGRQGRRERRLDCLEDLQEHLPRHDRQRARARSAGHERGGEAEAHPARPRRSQPASPSSPRSRSRRARMPATAIRTASIGWCCRPRRNGSSSWTARMCRRARAARAGPPPRPLPPNRPGRRRRRKPDNNRNREPRRLPAQPPGRSRQPARPHLQASRPVLLGSTGEP